MWPYGSQIQYSVYQNGRWRDPVALSGNLDDGHGRLAPALAIRNGVVAVVWSEHNDQGAVQLFTTRLIGESWSAPAPVLAAPLPDWWVLPSAIALTDSQVMVAWGQWGDDGRGRLLLARRSLQGGDWRYTQVSPTVASDWCIQERPQLRTDGDGYVHVVWSGCALRNPPDEWPHDSFIFYARSINGGATFGQPLRVGQTIAPEDEEHHNDTASRPALALGADGEVMVIYPGRSEGVWTFYATLIRNNVVAASQRIGELATNWTPAGEYGGNWYEGDSAGAIGYDAIRQRYVAVFPDRRNERAPTLYAATYGGSDILPRLYLPAVTR